MRYFMSILFCGRLGGEERADCFAWFVFLVSCGCCVALPHGAMGLFAVCDFLIITTHYFCINISITHWIP